VRGHGRQHRTQFAGGQLPQAEEGESAAGAQRAPDVAERRHRVGEEHDPEAADRHVESADGEGVDLGVAAFVGDVGQALGAGGGASAFQYRGGQVDADHLALGCPLGRQAGGLAVAAADVQHPFGAVDGGGGEQRRVEAAVDRVVAVLERGPVAALVAVPGLGLFGVHDLVQRRALPRRPPRGSPGACPGPPGERQPRARGHLPGRGPPPARRRSRALLLRAAGPGHPAGARSGWVFGRGTAWWQLTSPRSTLIVLI